MTCEQRKKGPDHVRQATRSSVNARQRLVQERRCRRGVEGLRPKSIASAMYWCGAAQMENDKRELFEHGLGRCCRWCTVHGWLSVRRDVEKLAM